MRLYGALSSDIVKLNNYLCAQRFENCAKTVIYCNITLLHRPIAPYVYICAEYIVICYVCIYILRLYNVRSWDMISVMTEMNTFPDAIY
jgi:hypothetical protein